MSHWWSESNDLPTFLTIYIWSLVCQVQGLAVVKESHLEFDSELVSLHTTVIMATINLIYSLGLLSLRDYLEFFTPLTERGNSSAHPCVCVCVCKLHKQVSDQSISHPPSLSATSLPSCFHTHFAESHWEPAVNRNACDKPVNTTMNDHVYGHNQSN